MNKMKSKGRTKKNDKKRYYVMYGFEEADPSNTAYLRIKSDSSCGDPLLGPYSIVSDAEYATLFPLKNYDKKRGFGTPYQWADFFATEEELTAWNFHPVPFTSKKMAT